VSTQQDHQEQQPDWKTAASGAMARYGAGDDTAFPELYRHLAPRLRAFLSRRLRDPSQAEDVLQQAFLQIHAARRRLSPGSEVTPWAFAIARRLLIDGFRKPRLDIDDAVVADTLAAAPGASPPALVAQRRLMSRVGEALEQISPTHRIAFELVKLDGMGAPEVAQMLGTTATGVRLRVHRALQELRDALEFDARAELAAWT
jgi:RNA polymerase sigma-70 factor (ECF subfamily)